MGPPSAGDERGIVLQHLTKTFPDGVVAVQDLSLVVDAGEFVILVGPSGCGKSTTLRIVAGLESATSGTVRIGNREVDRLPPRDRDIAMVFQNYALYAHMTVRDNIGFGLKMGGMPRRDVRRRVDDAAEILGLTAELNRKPRQLSGGQRQRVAMGRAIVREPAAFLMDEPLSNLDAKLRVDMRNEIIRIQRRLAAPTLYVTHDQTEAMTMADRVAILRDGRLEQIGSPNEVYDRPANMFVGSFIGSPPMNFLPAMLTRNGDGHALELGGPRLQLPSTTVQHVPGLEQYVDRNIVLGIRPESFGDTRRRPTLETVPIEAQRTESLGSDLMLYFDLLKSSPIISDRDVSPAVPSQRPLIARLPRQAEANPRHIGVAVDQLHFFDAGTSLAII